MPNLEKMIDDLIAKFKQLVSNETSQVKAELQEVRNEFAKFKLETIQKNHEFQLNLLEKQFNLGNNKKEIVSYSDFDINFDEEKRLLTILHESVSGEKIEKSIKIPTLVYKGVFNDEDTYEKGDCVTQGGSLWVCKQDEVKQKPGTEEAKEVWQLAVKKGRDGKDLKEVK